MTSLTRKEFYKRFDRALMKAYLVFFDNSPVDTGFLRSSILAVELENGFQIVVDNVPYMEYTEEVWTRASGAKNPNQGWFEDSFKQAFDMIVKEMRT